MLSLFWRMERSVNAIISTHDRVANLVLSATSLQAQVYLLLKNPWPDILDMR